MPKNNTWTSRQGTMFHIAIPYAQELREVLQGTGNSSSDSYTRPPGGHGGCLDGSECTGIGEGGSSTKEKAQPNDCREGRKMDFTEKGQETMAGRQINGAVAPSLESFIWLVEFIEEHALSMEVWFHKLCYIYENGKQMSRRKLTATELQQMYE